MPKNIRKHEHLEYRQHYRKHRVLKALKQAITKWEYEIFEYYVEYAIPILISLIFASIVVWVFLFYCKRAI